jgi:hypothetical protein
MPQLKHRRKSGGKAVVHPGRGKPGKAIDLSWLDEPRLPLFNWAKGLWAARKGPPPKEQRW